MAAERTVDVTLLLHHHGEVHRVLDLAATALGADKTRASGHVALGEHIGRSLVSVVDDLHTLERHAGTCGGLLDHGTRAYENRGTDSLVEHAARGEKGLLCLALGKRHTLGRTLGVLDELFDQGCHLVSILSQ